MAVCTLTLPSTLEALFLLLLQAARISALLLRILRIRAFALDSSVPLYLHLLFLLQLVSWSLPFVVCSPLAELLQRVEATEVDSPDIMNLCTDFIRGQTFRSPASKGGFQHVLVNRFLTRVEGGHCRADEFVRQCLEMMHESGELWVRIRKIKFLIFHEAEMLQDFEMGLFSIFSFKPFLQFLGSFFLDLIPDPDMKS